MGRQYLTSYCLFVCVCIKVRCLHFLLLTFKLLSMIIQYAFYIMIQMTGKRVKRKEFYLDFYHEKVSSSILMLKFMWNLRGNSLIKVTSRRTFYFYRIPFRLKRLHVVTVYVSVSTVPIAYQNSDKSVTNPYYDLKCSTQNHHSWNNETFLPELSCIAYHLVSRSSR